MGKGGGFRGFDEDFVAAHQAKMARITGLKSAPKTETNPALSPYSGKTADDEGDGKGTGGDTPLKTQVFTTPVKRSKYGSSKVVIDGVVFDSQKEGNRYLELKAKEQAGEISGLELQVVFILAPSVVLKGRKKPALKYLADFGYTENGVRVIEDVKSYMTRKLAVYRMKIHLMKSVLNIDVRET